MPLTGYSWRLTFVCYGLVAFTVALAWLLLGRDTKPAATEEGAGITGVFLNLLKLRKVVETLSLLQASHTKHCFCECHEMNTQNHTDNHGLPLAGK